MADDVTDLFLPNNNYFSFLKWETYGYPERSILIHKSFKNIKFDIALANIAKNYTIIAKQGEYPLCHFIDADLLGMNGFVVFRSQNEFLKWKLKI